MTPITLAQAIPVVWRRIIYSALATAIAIEAIVDLVDPAVETKVVAVLAVLGFGTALSNTNVE